MSPNFVFLSHSSKDAANLRPVVAQMRKQGINVWWSAELEEGHWDKEIHRRLRDCARVVGIITENADLSARDYIIEELDYARENEKLIPVVIGDRPESFAIRGIISRIQTYSASSFSEIFAGESGSKLIRVCLRATGPAEADSISPPEPISTPDGIEEWFEDLESKLGPVGQIHAFAYGCGIAMFEGSTFSEIESLSLDLARRLTESECEADKRQPESEFPKRSGSLLRLMAAEEIEVEHPALGLRLQVIRFADPDRAAALIRFVWREFGSRRGALTEWWRIVCDSASADRRTHLGFALGVLGQENFLDLFSQVLQPWLFADSPNRRSVADIAISVACFEPAVSRAAEHIIRNWSESGSEAQRAAAVRLACGFTGSRIPGLTIDVLNNAANRAAKSDDEDLFNVMRSSLRGLMAELASNPDNSLFDLAGLIDSLANWIKSVEQDHNSGRQNPYPITLFLSVVYRMPLKRNGTARGRLSLDTLIANDFSARSAAEIFAHALQRHRVGTVPTRELALDVLRSWIEDHVRSTRDFETRDELDPLLRIVRFIASAAETYDDVDRIAHMFEGLYTFEQICPHAK